jgi:hypothetical protein
MGLRRNEDHWLWSGGPVPPGADAITIGSLIIVRKDAAGSERLLRHELVHVHQWREFGAVGFLRRYVRSYLRWRVRGYGHWGAYNRIPLEVEAYWLARAMPPPAPPPAPPPVPSTEAPDPA